MKLTITEALAAIKTTKARIAKKTNFVEEYVVRRAILKDPLAAEAGGSPAAVARERQAIQDLMLRWVRLRCAIANSNATTSLALHGETRTVAEWLTWRREVSGLERTLLAGIQAKLREGREFLKKNRGAVAGEADAAPGEMDVAVNVDESEIAKSVENLEARLGDLDGQLSLLNATTFVEIED